MKTLLKLNIAAMAAMAILAFACKSKSGGSSPDSTASASTPSSTAAAAKGNSVMDSLNITDPDEKKICATYDEAITDYLSNYKTLMTDTSKAAQDQKKALDAKWKAKSEELKPQIEGMRKRLAANPTEVLKYEQFSMYESKRLMGVMGDYQKQLMKNMPTSVPAAK